MDTLTIAAVAKVVTDYLMKLSGYFKWTLPDWFVHVLVAGLSTGIMYGYDHLYGLPFSVLQTLQSAFSAVGIDQVVNGLSSSSAPQQTPSVKVNP